MSDSKHVQGPWEWKDDDRENHGHYRLAPGILVTNVSDGTPWGDEIDRANARLIAAAPDLLEACRKVVNNWSDLHPKDLAQLRAAIAKAGG